MLELDIISLIFSSISLIIAILAILISKHRVDKLNLVLESLIKEVNVEKKIREISKKYRLRPKKRYIVFEVFPSGLKEEDMRLSIDRVAREVIGLKGISEAKLKLIYYNEERSRGILRVRREYKYVALAILGLIRNVKNVEVLVTPLTSTGSLKRAKKFVST